MEVTYEKLEQLFDHKLEPINTKLTAIEETVAKHTEMLDGVASDVKKLLDEKTVTTERLDRLEHWAEPASKKLGVKLEL